MLSKWVNEQVHSENYILFAWKLISFHFSCNFYPSKHAGIGPVTAGIGPVPVGIGPVPASYHMFTGMLYILVLKICLKYFKHYIQLSQMSKMSNSRSRTQYITLKLIPLDSVPSNWDKR